MDVFEAELLRNPYSLSTWLSYISSSPSRGARLALYDRSVTHLPGSYKLWMGYVKEAVKEVERLCLTDARNEQVAALFERGLVFMHKMPLYWLEYVAFLCYQRLLTRTRRVFDRALQSLPLTQHAKVWPGYLEFAKQCGCRDTCVRVFRRYLMLNPGDRLDFVAYLKAQGDWDEAALQLTHLVNGLGEAAGAGGGSHSLWLDLCDLVSRHPKDMRSVPVEAVLRSGIHRFTDEVGRVWCALAEHFVRLGEFERARDIYEEALATLGTVRDFATVFDAYVQFEEALLTARLEMVGAGEAGGMGDSAGPEAGSGSSSSSSSSSSSQPGGGGSSRAPGAVSSLEDLEDLAALNLVEADDTELRISRLELLMDRRPLLLSSVLLRQNPHNVHEWHNRAKLFKAASQPSRVIATYAEALKAVQPSKAVGKLQSLWVAFAQFYEEHEDLVNARTVFRQGTEASFKSPDDLAVVWCEWAEMELRHKEHAAALRIMQEATRDRTTRGSSGSSSSSSSSSSSAVVGGLLQRLRYTQRVWSLYLDLEESLGTLDTVRAAYESAMAIKVVTPAMVLTFATYCEERGYFEESFRAYERGVALFPWPQVKELWLAYLTKFVARYGGSKLERARDLFEQAVAGAPASEAAPLYLAYASLEEQFGLARHVMAVYDRAVGAVEEGARYAMFLAYIRKAEEAYGAPRTREIYARAIDVLPEQQVADMCLRFADLETKLGELDRARAIFAHAASFSDPRKATAFWGRWQEWETANGNEESFMDMLRTKRSVGMAMATSYSGVEDILESAAAKKARNA